MNSIRIGGTPPLLEQQSLPAKRSNSSVTDSQPAPQQEMVTLSPAAQALLQNPQGPNQNARIEALRSQIAAGNYAVEPAKIARGLLQDQLQLLAAPGASSQTP